MKKIEDDLTDEEKLTAAGGVPKSDIGHAGKITFTLEDSGETVIMRKPLVEDLLASQDDKTVVSGNFTHATLAIISQIALFNGRPKVWHDLKKYTLMDYNEMVEQYNNLTESGKSRKAV